MRTGIGQVITLEPSKNKRKLVGVAEWLVHGSGELRDPTSNPSAATVDFSVIAEWPNNTHMLPNPSQSR